MSLNILFQVKKLQSLGDKALVTHRLTDALKCYNDAVEIDEDNIESLYGRANIFVKIGKYILAQHDADKVIMLDPDNFRVSKQGGSYVSTTHTSLSQTDSGHLSV